MNKLSIMLVDLDEKYLMPIELKFIEELEDKVDIMIISDESYLKEYFSSPKKIDVLVINENLYTHEFEKHNIGNTFILIENEGEGSTENLNVHRIYKYKSVKKLYSDIMNNSVTKSMELLNKIEETKVFMIYSPSGGSGKTTVGIGLAAALTGVNRKVLYISTESLQSFYFVKTEKYCPSGFDKLMISREENILDSLDSVIDNNIFDYLLPFRQALSSINIKLSDYQFLIDKIKSSGKYDYIIVDTSTDLTAEKSMLMSKCDKVILLAGQGKEETIKLNSLLFNIDCSNESKFLFICNKYLQNKENHLIKDEFLNKCNIVEYIEYFNEENITVQFLANNVHFSKLAYMIS
jgi:cellulose biosynthesis protein BcsQ